MAYQSVTETLLFPSSSSPFASRLEEAKEDKYRHLQNTIPFDDTELVDSPLAETQLERLDFNTEIVDDPDLVEGVRIQPMCEYEKAVVLDSEDEEVQGTKAASDVNVLSFDRTCRRIVKSALVLPTNVDFDVSAAENCGGGINGCSVNNTESINGKKVLPQLLACEQDFARLNYVGSQEPAESSQANALDFVNQFLSSGNVDSSPVINFRKTVRVKSPPVSRAKGPHSLAKRIKPGTPFAQTGTFEWVDDNQQGARVFGKNMQEASFDFGGFKEGPATRHQKAKRLDHKGGCSRANECEDVVDLQKNITGSTHAGQYLEAYFSGRDTLDMADIGINTQIAAEAMEALFNGPPPGCSASDAYPGPQNTPKDSNIKAHMKQASVQQSISPDSGGISWNITRRKRSTRKVYTRIPSSSGKHSKIKLNTEIAITTRAKGGKFLSDSWLNCIKLTPANENGKTEGTIGMNNTEEHQNYKSLSRMIGHSSLGNGKLQGQPVCPQARLGMTGGRLKSSHSDHETERMSGVTERGVTLTSKSKRKRRHSVANLFEVSCATEKCSTSSSNTPEEARNGKRDQGEQTGRHVASITIGLKSDTWNYPRRKRSFHKVRSHSNGACSLYAPLAKVDGKESGTCHQRRSESKDTWLHGSECATTVNCTEGVNLPSGKEMSNEYRKEPCKKNLPKSYMLKELMRLGVPKSIPDFMYRSVRRQRNMRCVRILLSQHLDDDTIKQQKKILARLSLFTASSSMDATHFIADRFVRTRNMLEAIALGKPVVTPLWLESCGQASCLIDDKNYILRDAKKEKEIGFSMPVSLARASRNPLLKGQRVFITPNIKPDKETIISLIMTVHGQAMEQNQIPLGRDQKIPDDLLVLSCEEDRAICEPLINKGVAVYSSELLLNGIITQKLEFARHRLFANSVKRNRSNRRRSRKDAALSLPPKKCFSHSSAPFSSG